MEVGHVRHSQIAAARLINITIDNPPMWLANGPAYHEAGKVEHRIGATKACPEGKQEDRVAIQDLAQRSALVHGHWTSIQSFTGGGETDKDVRGWGGRQ